MGFARFALVFPPRIVLGFRGFLGCPILVHRSLQIPTSV